MIHLTLIQSSDPIETLFSNYQIKNAQFTAYPLDALKNFEWQTAYPIAIKYENQIIGFFILDALKGQTLYDLPDDSYLLRSFSIHQSFLRKGYAKKALTKLPAWLKHQDILPKQLYLAVNYKNQVAQKLYLSVGIKDTGLKFQGVAGEQYLFVLNFENFQKNH